MTITVFREQFLPQGVEALKYKKQKIMNKKKLVVLTGAGMSAESGLSTFRDTGGLWDTYRIEDVATPEGWNKNPQLVTDFYNQRRLQLLQVEPNEGHRMLAGLENEYDVRIITQNIDNLHERAGSTHVIHLHGELTKVRSTGPGEEVFELTPDNYTIRIGDKCPKGYQLRPHIVWFGEAVPEIENAIDLTGRAEIFLVIGTSLNVYPAAGLLHYVPAGAPIYLIDPNDVPVSRHGVTIIKKGGSEGMKDFIRLIKAPNNILEL
ncbi:MAG: Silent information regulator protein Sir2 [Bacteroidetes bacterium]|nr:Silent information regulator protein Sir2 [Bacteroidota bacterium]